ncbi:MAG: arsenate reductase family protein [Deltaproteobacteria bacterium]|nr:arsenate reductase family protein [Deltaproteobacteria bacterium]
MITVYCYDGCSTCKKALKWLDQHGLAVRSIDLKESPPSKAALKRAWKASGLPLKKLFNVAGQSYRGGGFKERLPQMSEDEQLASLAADGMLVKRPLLVGDDVVLVGFKEADWAAVLL